MTALERFFFVFFVAMTTESYWLSSGERTLRTGKLLNVVTTFNVLLQLHLFDEMFITVWAFEFVNIVDMFC